MQNLKSISLTKYIIFTVCVFILSVCDVYSQSVEEFLEALPKEYFNNLTSKDRDKLLSENKFYPEDNDENYIQVYRVVESTNDYMKATMSFETGQRGFNTFELKRWNLNAGDYLFGISRVAGTPVEFVQADINFFIFDNDSLKKVLTKIPTDLGLDDFTKQNTPDKLIQEYSQYISLSITFEKEGNDIYWRVHENMGVNDLDNSWLKGNAIRYSWDGEDFKKTEIFQYP
ncbi:hypothetical protein [Rhodohalobacter sp.]|uniref:hypothetical protein n=1 Tax=Rhodohalobacter sp. TaxID=1974210 RepID=UPI002ACE1891|nr:hypothetical protein [Rhodohalobacter sp.]MDZ7755030.1 hypothetical protein [Rhodohalobacter sp.]